MGDGYYYARGSNKPKKDLNKNKICLSIVGDGAAINIRFPYGTRKLDLEAEVSLGISGDGKRIKLKNRSLTSREETQTFFDIRTPKVKDNRSIYSKTTFDHAHLGEMKNSTGKLRWYLSEGTDWTFSNGVLVINLPDRLNFHVKFREVS